MKKKKVIISPIEAKFNEMVSTNKRVYLSKDVEIKQFLKDRKKRVKIEFAGLTPEVDDIPRFRCLTCGSVNKSHPDTSFCFVCDTDNWDEI